MAIGVKRSGGGAVRNRVASRTRRHLRVRKRIRGSAAAPRLVVSRSSRHVFVQVIDDVAGRTLASASTMEAELRSLDGDKTDIIAIFDKCSVEIYVDGGKRFTTVSHECNYDRADLEFRSGGKTQKLSVIELKNLFAE